MNGHEKIVDKIRKLKAHAESAEMIGSEAEAQAFAAAMQRLMNEHTVTMTDIEFKDYERDEPVDEWRIDYSKYDDIKVKSSRIAWIERLSSIVAKAYHCQILVTQGSSSIILVGRSSDCEVAEYMIVTLQRSAEKLARKEYGAYFRKCQREGNVNAARGFRTAFLQGFVMRLAARLEEERDQQMTSSSTALVRVDKKMRAIVDFMSGRSYGKSKALRSRASLNAAGVARGRKMADDVDLRANGVKAGATPKGELT